MENSLSSKKCIPCEGGELPLSHEQVEEYMKEIGDRWSHNVDDNKIEREWKFENFVKSIEFVNRVSKLAEMEGHHPDIYVHYNKVKLVLWTHAIGGLHENDFILAAKINEL